MMADVVVKFCVALKDKMRGDQKAFSRFMFLWNWASDAVAQHKRSHPSVRLTNIEKSLDAAKSLYDQITAAATAHRKLEEHLAATQSSSASASASSSPQSQSTVVATADGSDKQLEADTDGSAMFFDKTVQTLVHEQLPMGVIMQTFGPRGYARGEPPVVNNMLCEMFGIARSDFTELLWDVSGWRRVYHPTVHVHKFRECLAAIAAGQSSYVTSGMYVHNNGWAFEGLETRRISYAPSGVPLYVTIYIQRCDGPSSTMTTPAASVGAPSSTSVMTPSVDTPSSLLTGTPTSTVAQSPLSSLSSLPPPPSSSSSSSSFR
eukprot:TRINITY_DN67703_c1_g1_i1.p1 TRINITY_DN67703_c1_g1~~TRINITY_DN67703_c1_g1_i1.p1  ORF type:complete len:359 (+),score=186.18 TRINITY_DN67703_c1_g1_i1:121-1077(+)